MHLHGEEKPVSLNVVAFGGGTDSTAMVIGMYQRGIPIDLCLFADTGGERPETYRHVREFSEWMRKRGMPEIITVKKVRRNGDVLTLEQNCLEKRMLPSIAYGFKSCSQKYKIQPQDKFCNNWQPAQDVWKRGGKVTKFIGYDASEERRAHIVDDDKYAYRYPLIEWDWDREQCIEVIEREGLARPGKSACFFCPSTKKAEILELRQAHPELFDRAVAMEGNALLTSIKGLGRYFLWRDLIAFGMKQLRLVPETPVEMACGCLG